MPARSALLVLFAWVSAFLFLAGPRPSLGATNISTRFTIDSWTTENGLPQNSIVAMAQTPDGYLWLATFNGLARFDGVRFKVFHPLNSPGLMSERIMDLVVDGRGGLFVFCESGEVSRFANGHFEHLNGTHDLPAEKFNSKALDPDGYAWLNNVGGVRFFRTQGDHAHELIPGHVRCKGRLPEIAISRGSYWLKENGAWQMVFKDEALAEMGVHLSYTRTASGTGRDGKPIVVAGNRVVRSLGASIRELEIEISEPTDVIEDSEGNVFIATWTQGLLVLSPSGALESIPLGVENSSAIRNLLLDQEGNVWVGTDVAGLSRLKRKAFENLDRQTGLRSEVVKAGVIDREGAAWVAHRRGIDRVPSRGDVEAVMDVADLWSATLDGAGRVCFGSYQGTVWRMENGRPVSYPRFQHAAGQLWSLSPARDGGLWIGFSKGLAHLGEQKIEWVDLPAMMPNKDVRGIFEDSQNQLWLGTYGGGLIRRKGSEWTRFGADAGLRDERILCLYQDADGSIWTGTALGGLHRFKDGRFAPIPTATIGLPEFVSCIVEDDFGFLWLGSLNGIHRVPRRNLDAIAEGRGEDGFVRHFGKADGMGASECAAGMQPTVCKSADGRIWFATVNGLSVTNPRNLPHDAHPPRAVIEEAWVDDKQKFEFEGTAGPEITLVPGSERLEVRFTALALGAPLQARFKYRLEGYDDGWIDPGSRRTAYYNRLPPGNYRMRVVAANQDGIWSVRGATLGVTMLPFFWQTLWFQSLAVAALGGLVLGIVNYRIRSIERESARQQELSRLLIESQEDERRHIARELHDGLGQDLLLIKNRALLGLAPGAASADQCAAISNSASQALQQVREISNNLRPYQLDELGLTAALRGIFDRVRGASPIRFEASLDPVDNLFPRPDECHIFRIVQELTNNVLKHSGATEARVEVARRDAVEITVSDNGSGFDNSIERSRSGFGLRGIAERIGILHAEMKIETSPGQGTKIRLSLPIPHRETERAD